MTPLERLLEMYKFCLEGFTTEGSESMEEVSKEVVQRAMEIVSSVEPKEPAKISKPQKGEVIEIVPSLDGVEMLFLVAQVGDDFVSIVPLSRFYEFATTTDVILKLGTDTYIAQTELVIDIPKERFSERFVSRSLIKVGEVSGEDLERVLAVLRGEAKGDGGMSGGVKEEFKRLEAQRYFPIFAYNAALEEKNLEVESFFEEHREVSLAAAQQEKTWGSKEGIRWIYDPEEETLILIPNDEYKGKEIRVIVEAQGDSLVLFEGEIQDSVEVGLSKGNYSYKLLEEGLRVESV